MQLKKGSIMPETKTRIIVGITGASGSIYAVRLLEQLKAAHVETHLVISRAALQVIPMETGMEAAEVAALADFRYSPDDIAAAISSGSFRTAGMIVARSFNSGCRRSTFCTTVAE